MELFSGKEIRVGFEGKTPRKSLTLCVTYILGLYSMWINGPGHGIVWSSHIFLSVFQNNVPDSLRR